jgi:hypothetical protein
LYPLTAFAWAAIAAARSSPFSSHLLHIVSGVIALLAVPAVYASARRRERGRAREIVALHDELVRRGVLAPDGGAPPTDQRAPLSALHPAALRLAALGLVGAALIHAVVAPEHFTEAISFGVFFSISAVAQLVFATWIIAAPSRPLLHAAVASSLAMVALWALTRTVGVPFGPEPGEAEAVGPLDLAACACELLTASGAMLALRRRDLRPLIRRPADSRPRCI